MKLLGTTTSPFVRKVRIALEEKRIPYEFMVARPSDPSSGISKINPLGKIPVLVRDDGTAVYDSPVIIEYVDGLSASTRLIPPAFAARIEVRRWEALGDGVLDAAIGTSHMQGQAPEWHLKQKGKIEAGLATMERDLGSQQFCFGGGFSLADIACGVALFYLDRAVPNLEWRGAFPSLRLHAERLGQRNSFTQTMPAL